MKLNLKYIIAVSALVGMAGCDDKIEPFEITALRPRLLQSVLPLFNRKHCRER